MEYDSVDVDSLVTDKFMLMEIFGNSLLLGRMKFDNWDQFEELMISKFEYCDEKISISGIENIRLDDESQKIFLEIIANISKEFPNRLVIL